MKMETVVEWTEGDICEDKGKVGQLIFVSSGRIVRYLFHVCANRDAGKLSPAKFSIHPSCGIKFLQFSLCLNIHFSS